MIMSQIGTSIDATYVAMKLKEWSEKSKKPIDELKTKYQELLAKTEGRTDAIKYKKALNKMLTTFDTNMKSTAISYEVIVLGSSAPADLVKRKRKLLEDKYKLHAAECIAEGSVRLDDNGGHTLIDTVKAWPGGAENYNFGKPIPQHTWVTTLYAVAKKPGEDQKWMATTINLRDELALVDVPLFKEMDIRLNGKYSTQRNSYVFNSSASTTNFGTVKRDVPMSEIIDIVDTVYANKFVLPAKLQEDLDATKADFNRFIVTEATLNRHYLNQNGISSIELVDESLDFGETITGFVDPNIRHLLAEIQDGSTVCVIAQTSTLREKDQTTKEYTGEESLGMNVYCVFERPE